MGEFSFVGEVKCGRDWTLASLNVGEFVRGEFGRG